MKDTDSMTMQDVLEMMKCIREFFTVVRLESGYDTMDSEETYCEIEYLKEDIFFVKAKRIEIDGKPYVIKIKQEVDSRHFQQPPSDNPTLPLHFSNSVQLRPHPHQLSHGHHPTVVSVKHDTLLFPFVKLP